MNGNSTNERESLCRIFSSKRTAYTSTTAPQTHSIAYNTVRFRLDYTLQKATHRCGCNASVYKHYICTHVLMLTQNRLIGF